MIVKEEQTCVICKKKFNKRRRGMKDRAYKKELRPYRSLTCSPKCAVLYNRMPLKKRNFIKRQGGITNMEIKSLKDLKNALIDIPDSVLDNFGAGWNPECQEYDIGLMVWCDEEHWDSKWSHIKKIAPQIIDIDKWITNLGKVAKAVKDDDEYEGAGWEDMISSKDELD